MTKRVLPFALVAIALLYTIAPYFFEKVFFLNEVLALAGFLLLAGNRFTLARSPLNWALMAFMVLCALHTVTSVFRADSVYLFLRNSVIFYSAFSFFVGYFLYLYFDVFFKRLGVVIGGYVTSLLFFPVSHLVYDRFSVSVLFPLVASKSPRHLVLLVLAAMAALYSVFHESSTSLILTGLFILLFVVRSYFVFATVIGVGLVLAGIGFAWLVPDLSIDSSRYSYYNEVGIWELISRRDLFRLDPNTTWRLVLWKQLLVDQFPANLLGIGFGTPALQFFPIEDYDKLSTLPYVLGGHNSFVYLFCRLGLLFLGIFACLYHFVFSYFFQLRAEMNSKSFFYLLAFLSISTVALFNPVLETPVYASVFWIALGLVSRSIETSKN